MKYVIKIIWYGQKNFLCKQPNEIKCSKHPFKDVKLRKFNKLKTVVNFARKMQFWNSDKNKVIITRNDGKEFKLSDTQIICKLLDK